jgi:hypothetical protein
MKMAHKKEMIKGHYMEATESNFPKLEVENMVKNQIHGLLQISFLKKTR